MAPAAPRALAITVIATAVAGVSLWQLHDRATAPPAPTPLAASAVVQARVDRPGPRAVMPPDRSGRTDVAPAPEPAKRDAEAAREAIALTVRAAHASDGDRRAAMLRALADSGPAEPARAAAATARVRRWHAALDPDIAGAIELGAPRCYRGGCAIEVAFATEDAYEMARDHLRRQPADPQDGGRLQTPATARDDGWLVADWIALDKE
jgi:hypothetical protein